MLHERPIVFTRECHRKIEGVLIRAVLASSEEEDSCVLCHAERRSCPGTRSPRTETAAGRSHWGRVANIGHRRYFRITPYRLRSGSRRCLAWGGAAACFLARTERRSTRCVTSLASHKNRFRHPSGHPHDRYRRRRPIESYLNRGDFHVRSVDLTAHESHSHHCLGRSYFTPRVPSLPAQLANERHWTIASWPAPYRIRLVSSQPALPAASS